MNKYLIFIGDNKHEISANDFRIDNKVIVFTEYNGTVVARFSLKKITGFLKQSS